MGNCQEGTVFIKGGQYKGLAIPDLCVDQHEFTYADATIVAAKVADSSLLMSIPQGFVKPNRPITEIEGRHAKKFCEAQGKRLLTPLEWEYVASQAGTKLYSTRSGKLDVGVYYYVNDSVKTEREVCAAVGHYVEYGGKEVCDMNGNVWEWTYNPSGDFYISGGCWGSSDLLKLQADSRMRLDSYGRGDGVGFRCGLPSQGTQ